MTGQKRQEVSAMGRKERDGERGRDTRKSLPGRILKKQPR